MAVASGVPSAVHAAGVERLLASYRAIPAGGLGPAGQADLQPVPVPGAEHGPRPGHLGPDRGHLGRSRREDRRGGRHVHLRGPGRGHAAVRAVTAGGTAAEDDHPRRSRQRSGHRVGLLPQRDAARVGAGAGHPDRGRRGDHRLPASARRPVPGVPQLLRHARLRGASADRAGDRRSLRRPPSCPLPLVDRPDRGDERHRRKRQPGRHPGRLPRRRGVQRRRELPERRSQNRRGRTGQRLHRAGHLLPIDPARPAARSHDRLTIHDYLWRWDTDWFWCSAAFGAQHPRLRRWWPRRYRRSSFYWKLLAYEQRLRIVDRLEKLHGRPPRERVVQDVEVPIERCAEFLDWFLSSVPIEPIWLCPVRQRDRWSLYPMRTGHTYVNLGFWSSVPGRRRRGRDEPADRAEGP